MPNEALITEIENLLAEVVQLGGENERTSIVPNLTVQDANPAGLSGFLIVSDDRDGDNILAKKVGSVVYANNDLVNVMFVQGGEAIAFQQGSQSPNNGIWEIVPSTSTDIFYNKGNVGIGNAVPTTLLDVSGTVTITDEILHAGDTDTKIGFTTDVITFTAGDEVLLTLTEAAQDVVKIGDGGDVDINFNDDAFLQGSNGFLHIGGTDPDSQLVVANAIYAGPTAASGNTDDSFVTIGLVLNQEANDNSILVLKSSDVAHGITNNAETDSFFDMLKANATAGGCSFRGFSELVTGFNIQGFCTTEVTTSTTASTANVFIQGRLKSGTGSTVMGDTANVFAVRNATTTILILKGNGDLHLGGINNGAITDDYDDALLLSGYRAIGAPVGSPARKRFTGFLEETEDILIQQGVLSAPLADGGMVSDSALKGLLIDAIIQLNGKINRLEGKLNGLN